MGKPVGNDAAADKSTYVALHGIDGARAEATRQAEFALASARELHGNNARLLQLIEDLDNRIN